MSIHKEFLEDAEFGTVHIARNRQSKYVRLRMQPDGELKITMPPFASMRHAQQLVDNSRDDIRAWKKKHTGSIPVFANGDSVGHSHTVRFVEIPADKPSIRTNGLDIIVYTPRNLTTSDPSLQKLLRPHILKAIQKEARAYLPRRLKYLAEQWGFHFERTRFGTQKGRWGSCSAKGTISLNVGLMLLPDELIDYVLIHELCHTREMNHSAAFWKLVETCLPDYKPRRAALKKIQPLL